MTYICYQEKRFNAKSQQTIETANEIIREYQGQGYTLTLRQLYYQFVSRNLIENTERSYKALGAVINDARIAGEISWNAIEDRARESHIPFINENMQEAFNAIEYGYAVDVWARQPVYLEVWVEKEALGNVVERPCNRFRVPHMACKGYLSASQAWRAGQRFEEARDRGQKCVLIHLGDHDPSGIDMTRDNGERLEMFSRGGVTVERIALNMDQVNRYNPPPNPAKITDTRAQGYIQKFGNKSWELDALEPSVIDQMIVKTIQKHMNTKLWNEALKEEEEARAHLKRYYDEFEFVDAYMKDNNHE
jgi:hypothetical protein